LHVLAAIDRDIGAGHERRPVRAQVDDKTCNFFGLAEASERDLRQDLSWDSPDDSRTGVNIIAFPSSLEDRREVRTATGIRSLSSQQQGKRFIQDRDAWDLGVAYHRHRLFLRGIFPPDPKWFVSSLLHGIGGLIVILGSPMVFTLVSKGFVFALVSIISVGRVPTANSKRPTATANRPILTPDE